jgi:hypothetical protein
MTPKQVETARRLGKALYAAERRSNVKAQWAAADAAAPKPGRVSDPGPLADPSLWCHLRRMWLRCESDPGLGGSHKFALDLLAPEPEPEPAPEPAPEQALEPVPEPVPEPAPEPAPEPVPEPAPPEICAMGTWNEPYLAEQVEAWQVDPCPGCLQHGAGVTRSGATRPCTAFTRAR